MQYITIGVIIIGVLLWGASLLSIDSGQSLDTQTPTGELETTERIVITPSLDPKVAAFMANTNPNPSRVTTPSGLQYAVLEASESQEYPQIDSTVEVHYHGTLENGEVFDSSVLRGDPISFPLHGVIAGWQEGIPLMNLGSKYRLIVPASLAYGVSGNGHPLAGQTLVFDVELISIVE